MALADHAPKRIKQFFRLDLHLGCTSAEKGVRNHDQSLDDVGELVNLVGNVLRGIAVGNIGVSQYRAEYTAKVALVGTGEKRQCIEFGLLRQFGVALSRIQIHRGILT